MSRNSTFDRITGFIGSTDENSSKEPSADTLDESFHHERAKEALDEWGAGATTLYHCGLCNQVFTSFDTLYDHRMASEDVAAREGDEFRQVTELTPGDEFPKGATVGAAEPCTTDFISK